MLPGASHDVSHQDEPPTKQVIVMRRDLGMRRGKEIAQGAHASMIWLAQRIRHRRYTLLGGRAAVACRGIHEGVRPG